MSIAAPPQHMISSAVRTALAEDLGDAGDITSRAAIPAGAQFSAAIAARQDGVICGVEIAREVFHELDATIEVKITIRDGDRVSAGDAIMRLSGSTHAILAGERTALNFLSHLSGVATATAALVRAIEGTSAQIVCTRKTTPGLRALEKFAVRCGGGGNHRFGLYDAVMIKDNHVAAAGGVVQALHAVKRRLGHLVKVEVEIDRLEQLEGALTGGADVIMLDNMSTEDMKKAVAHVSGRAILEASGNVTVESVRAIAETGVDVISSGWITHSAPALDLGLDFN